MIGPSPIKRWNEQGTNVARWLGEALVAALVGTHSLVLHYPSVPLLSSDSKMKEKKGKRVGKEGDEGKGKKRKENRGHPSALCPLTLKDLSMSITAVPVPTSNFPTSRAPLPSSPLQIRSLANPSPPAWSRQFATNITDHPDEQWGNYGLSRANL